MNTNDLWDQGNELITLLPVVKILMDLESDANQADEKFHL